MKKNDWVLLVSVLLYSYLFYEQAAGINFLLFNLALVAGAAIKNPEARNNRSWLIVAAGSIISSACIMIYSSPLAIVTNILSLAILSVVSFSPKTSVIVSLFLSFCSIGSSTVMMILDMIKRRKNSKEIENKRPIYVKVLMFMIVAVVTILFFVMYQNSNPLFKDFTKNINLDFISVPWLFFTLGGLLLLYGYYYVRHLGTLTSTEGEISNELDKEKALSPGFFNRLFKEDTEMLTGVALFAVLNIMLLVLNILDLNYLWFDGTLPVGIKHKEFVHDGVGTLILSVILAILIILYFFRGRLNYNENNKWLRWFTYIWIAQNAFMIFSTAYRMNMYIEQSGISYKKIGVYVYLGLTLIGLASTFIKVIKQKSNWYLFRVNPQAYYAVMVLSCLVNWDVYITHFNINKAIHENKKLEKYYLVDLSYKNLPDLLMLNDSIKAYDDYEARDYYFSLRGTYFYSFKSGLDKKLYDFLKDYDTDSDWQSYCVEKSRVFNDLLALNAKGEIKSIELNNEYSISTLKPLYPLDNIVELRLDNNVMRDVKELALFPKLKKLSLRSNTIDSIHTFPELKGLEDLDLSGNTLSGITALKNAPSLKQLRLESTSLQDVSILPEFENLEMLDISNNPLRDFSSLSRFKKLNDLNIGSTFNARLDSFPILENLKSLDLNNNGITASNSAELLGRFKSSAQLNALNLNNNQIGNLYGCINETTGQALFPALEKLYAYNNSIYTLAGIGVFTQLKDLQINSNNIKEIEPLFKLSKLQVLNLSNNPLQNIEGIEQLKELQDLNLRACHVRSGLDGLQQLKNLRVLDVSEMGLNSLEGITTITSLTKLYAVQNNIRSLKGIEKLVNLQELHLTTNNISDVKPLYALKNLRVLNIDYINQIELAKLKKALPDCKINGN